MEEDNRSFDAIMIDITSGFTGDDSQDRKYLQEQAEKYKDHKYNKEILRAIGRLIHEKLPEDKKQHADQVVGNLTEGMDSVLKEAEFQMSQKEPGKAYDILTGMINKIEKLDLYKEDAVSKYFCFRDPVEHMLYANYDQSDKTIRRIPEDYSTLYQYQGSALIDLQQLDEAREAFKKALKWNPSNIYARFENAETYKMTGDMETFADLTREAFPYAYLPEQLGRCYRNMGYYFIEKEMWKAAMACYLLAMHADPANEKAMSEMYYIRQKTGGKIEEPTADEIRMYSSRYGFPVGPYPAIPQILIGAAKHWLDEGDAEEASYYLHLAYELTKDDDIKEALEEVTQQAKDQPAGDEQ